MRKAKRNALWVVPIVLVAGMFGYGVWWHDAHTASATAGLRDPPEPPLSASGTPGSDPLAAAAKNGTPIRLVGLGSSVGVGATLPDPATQAPVARFASLLGDAYPRSEVTFENLSVNGSVATQGLTIYREQVRAMHPTAIVVAFGMNDGAPAEYNAGETLPGAISALKQLADEATADGTSVIFLTTPSPHTDRETFTLPAGVPVRYPDGGRPLPMPGGSVILAGGQPFSARHAAFNEKVRQLAENRPGVYLGDAAKYWVVAVARYGQDALFNAGESVHPDLLGHQQSYWLALRDVVEAIRQAGA